MGEQRKATGPKWSIGTWSPRHDSVRVTVQEAIEDIDHRWAILRDPAGDLFASQGGHAELEDHTAAASTPGHNDGRFPLVGWMPAVATSSLGSPDFLQQHGTRNSYVAGSMANGIASVELVSAMAREGCLSFYGSAGQRPAVVAEAIQHLNQSVPDRPWGCNLIHSPQEPTSENEISRILVAERVRCVEASAYLDVTEPLVRLRLQGLSRGESDQPVARIRVMAKASRLEVARRFLSPAPESLISNLLARGEISDEQARWGRSYPLCDNLTAEADSGGHTDNRPMTTLVPAFQQLRDEIGKDTPSTRAVKIGAAGGLGTPDALAAAFALGADYVVIGSVHQACLESGSSDSVRQMLSEVGPADVIMAPASDMFELGVHLQVLRRGTLFGPRAKRLLELYRNHNSIEELPGEEIERLQNEIFRMPLEQVWQQTHKFFIEREPAQIEKAETDPKHRMALLFRWYLGKSSDWANSGDPERQLDYQIWCGPAMGAFNEWTRGTWLAPPGARRIADVSRALMRGASLATRRESLRRQGISLCPGELDLSPRFVSDAASSVLGSTP
ncbi:MAG: PfaD family polyunsaturated fatty acid/polyketide biosynthesis protein [Planctomycetota bacterium]|nr:PfaD family polyunsaturated fatty acid/polyketide biosynthesis protein [Planctomycetota bacterium]